MQLRISSAIPAGKARKTGISSIQVGPASQSLSYILMISTMDAVGEDGCKMYLDEYRRRRIRSPPCGLVKSFFLHLDDFFLQTIERRSSRLAVLSGMTCPCNPHMREEDCARLVLLRSPDGNTPTHVGKTLFMSLVLKGGGKTLKNRWVYQFLYNLLK